MFSIHSDIVTIGEESRCGDDELRFMKQRR
jgi:hypothetical protein